MKLTAFSKAFLKNAINVSSVLGIEAFVIDGISLRGSDQSRGIAMILSTDGLEFGFNNLGVSRIPILKSRLTLLENAEVEFHTIDKGNDTLYVSTLEFSKGRTKTSFRCADPTTIKAAKSINDPVVFSVTATKEDIEMICRAIGSLKAEYATVTSDDDMNCSFKMSDTDGDGFTHVLANKMELVDDAQGSLAKSYRTDVLRPILQAAIGNGASEVTLEFTKRGPIRLLVSEIPVYIFPKA